MLSDGKRPIEITVRERKAAKSMFLFATGALFPSLVFPYIPKDEFDRHPESSVVVALFMEYLD